MKKVILLVAAAITFSSCCTLFSSSKQAVTFTGPEGTKIYDASNNMKLGEIGSEQVTTIKIKKKREDKTLIAKRKDTSLHLLCLNLHLIMLVCGISFLARILD